MIGSRRRRQQQQQPLLPILCGYVLWAFTAAGGQMVLGFAPQANHLVRQTAFTSSASKTLLAVAQYSPPSGGDIDHQEDKSPELAKNTIRFENLVSTVIATENPDHIPSLLTKEIDFLLSLKGEDVVNMIEGILSKNQDNEKKTQAIDMILSFAEAFVEQANEMDETNKKLLGKIIRAIAPPDHHQPDTITSTLAEREEMLDALLIAERENFTPRFLRHIQGECHRVATAKKQTRETARMLEVLQIIQARVVEELGKDLGEAATVLGQLIVYETSSERLAVLNAGLTVRGSKFGNELLDLATEALEGLQSHPNADPELIQRVLQIQDGIQAFLRNKAK